MSARLAEHLTAARRRLFFGRVTEQALFQSALGAAALPFHMLYIFGIGGVGKTTLLRVFAHLCEQAHTPAFFLDARNVEPSPYSFLDALRRAMSLAESESPTEVLAARSARSVLLIDTYELLSPMDGWLREVFLPHLPDNTLVVVASRRPPAPTWLADPGWASLVRPLPLGNLSPQEGQAYLAQRQIPAEHHQTAFDFTHGHPLALSLVADVIAQRPGVRFQPEAAPDVLTVLLQQFREQVPGPKHRAVLEACGMVRVTTEALLAQMLDLSDPHPLFEWLRELSFIDAGPFGLFPHDLARETLAADLRWRDPDCYSKLGRRASAYYIKRLQEAGGREVDRLLFDVLFLHRDNPVIRPLFDCFEWQESSGVFADAAQESDVPAIVAMVARHEGDESARLAAHWLARQLDRVVVFREATTDAQSTLAGFVMWLALHEASAEDVNVDPATRIAWQYVQRHAPLRHGEGATYRRFEMARDAYQGVSPIQSLNVVDWERHLLTTPRLGPVFKSYADPEFWAPMLAYAEVSRIPEADYEVGGRHYGVFGVDTRVLPPVARWMLITEKLAGASLASGKLPVTPQVPMLPSQSDFEAAVRDALRHWCTRHAKLQPGNPLLNSRLVAERAGVNASEAERVTALRDVLREAADTLQALPRQAKWYRALYHTYFQPAPSQEKAAELLDVPFSTFRRHLRSGIARMTEILWQWEISRIEE